MIKYSIDFGKFRKRKENSISVISSSLCFQMIGVCTGDLDLDHCRHVFCSMIGLDSNSWGISYTGQIQHKQLKESYSSKFGQGAIIGVHLDMWHGTLSFYKNRKPLGVLSKVLSFNVISFCLYFWPIYICLVLVNV